LNPNIYVFSLGHWAAALSAKPDPAQTISIARRSRRMHLSQCSNVGCALGSDPQGLTPSYPDNPPASDGKSSAVNP
jgi:hypothetical protein